MSTTELRIKALAAAMAAGEQWAKGLRKGDLFLGAGPVARERYPNRGERQMFLFGALNILEKCKVIIGGMDDKLTETPYQPRLVRRSVHYRFELSARHTALYAVFSLIPAYPRIELGAPIN